MGDFFKIKLLNLRHTQEKEFSMGRIENFVTLTFSTQHWPLTVQNCDLREDFSIRIMLSHP